MAPMEREELRARILANLELAGLSGARVIVGSTAQGTPRVRVVHEGMSSWSEATRRERLLAGVGIDLDCVELLAPEEEEWYGPAFPEDLNSLPLWTEALAEHSTPGSLIFASDLDADVERPAVVTFYSLRGGVGRTTALGSAAKVLASRGRRVLCIDMDFEAPGLSHFFGLSDPPEDGGALSLLMALEESVEVDVRDHVQRVSDEYELYCIPAGRLSVDYAKSLRFVDPEIWYREGINPLHRLLDEISRSTISPDVVLLDSRTGISPISAPLLFDVSDLAVICFFPHPQAQLGTELLVKALFNAETRRSSAEREISPEPRFLVSLIPPGPSAANVRERAAAWITSWFDPVQGRRDPDVGPLRGDELTHFVSYSTEAAFRDQLLGADNLRDVYGPVADWLEQLLPLDDAPGGNLEPTSKVAALEEMDFSTGTAEYQRSFFEDFVPTRTARSALNPRIPLVIGRKGTGKTAIFRWLLEKRPDGERTVAVMCPNAFRSKAPWVLGAAGFAKIESELRRTGRSWQDFWALYASLAAYFSLRDADLPSAPPSLGFGDLRSLASDQGQLDELHVAQLLATALGVDDCGLLGSRWLRQMDSVLSGLRMLLFDGLDTGFGNDDASRHRRSTAVTGLFTFMTEVEARLAAFSFKILLRYDIWQGLRFENKSHLLGRSVQLLWRDKAEYFKTVLKQATRSNEYVRALSAARLSNDVDGWLDEEVFRAWNLLIGERMKGGKTTFTRNWVWNRLADGQGDHGPRALSQLFSAAATWELNEEARSPYSRSIIRPRALVPSLESVSGEAIGALKEEFPELLDLINSLEMVGRTPLSISDIAAVNPEAVDEVELALEVGLLAPGDDVGKYRVPELYRHALKVRRPGQA